MTEEQLEKPSTGKSIGFALCFWAVYVAIVFTVLIVFFKLPF
jgi:hypothetical protein